MQVDQITDSIYSDFIILMTGGEVIPPAEEHRQILDAMVQGDDYTVRSICYIYIYIYMFFLFVSRISQEKIWSEFFSNCHRKIRFIEILLTQ